MDHVRGAVIPPSATSTPISGSDTAAIAASAPASRRPRSGARHTVSSANGASLNQPASASIAEQAAGRRHSSTATSSIAARTTSVVPVDTVISSGGNASQASAARSPASSASTGLGARARGRAPAVVLNTAQAPTRAASTVTASPPSTESHTLLTGANSASGV